MATFDHLTSGDVRIPSLAPWGLDLVPAYRVNLLTGQEDVAWRQEWFAWRDRVLEVRNEIQARCINDAAFLEEEVRRCSQDPAWFVTIWLWVEEPRPDEENLEDDGDIDNLKEFIPYAPQVRLMYLTVAIISSPTKHDLLVSKARGFGVSYTMAAVCYWAWLFRKWRMRFLSQKLEKADRSMDLDSLFAKIDLFMEYTPERFIPKGFNRGSKGRAVKHRQQAMFKNPETKGQITAEATTGDSVRGGRASAVFNDETAFQQQYRSSRATLGLSTRHRIDWSSESFRISREWWDTWHNAKKVNRERQERGLDPVATVLEIEWYENPYQDQVWYDTERAGYESDGNLEEFATEVMRDPRQHGTHVYPQVGDCDDTPEWFDQHRMLNIAVDPGMADDCAWVFWQNHFPEGKKRVRWLDMFIRNRLPAEWYAHVLTGILPVEGELCFRDEYYQEFFHSEIQYFMNWLKEVPSHMMTIYGDPAIESQDTGGSSFRRRFILTTQEITERAGQGNRAGREIMQPYKSIYKRNNFPDRRFALRKALMHSEFSLTDGAQQLKEAIGQVRFGEVTERTSLPPKVRHDRFTHPTSAAEFGMMYDDLLLTEDDLKPQKIAEPLKLRGRTPTRRQPRSRSRSGYADPIAIPA